MINSINLAPTTPGIIAIKPIEAAIKLAAPPVTVNVAIDDNPVERPIIDLANLGPLINSINLAPATPGIMATKPIEAAIKLAAPPVTVKVPIDDIPLAIPSIDFWNFLPSICSIALAPKTPGNIAVNPIEATIKLSAPPVTLPSPNAAIPSANPFKEDFTFLPSVCSIAFIPNTPGNIAIKPTAEAGNPINPPNITLPSPKALIPTATFFIFSLNLLPSLPSSTSSYSISPSSALPIILSFNSPALSSTLPSIVSVALSFNLSVNDSSPASTTFSPAPATTSFALSVAVPVTVSVSPSLSFLLNPADSRNLSFNELKNPVNLSLLNTDCNPFPQLLQVSALKTDNNPLPNPITPL